MSHQRSNSNYFKIALTAVLTAASLVAYAETLASPSFSSVEDANAYVRSIAPKEATCSENKAKLAGCYVSRGPAALWIDERYDADTRSLGVQIAVLNTSFPGADDYRQADAAFDLFIETSIKPFLSSLQLDAETIKKCTSKSKAEANIRQVLQFGEHAYQFSCTYTAGDHGRVFSYILIFAPK